LTIYENKISLKDGEPNAMILPFPGDTVDFKLAMNDEKASESVKELFQISKECFPVKKSKSNSKSASKSIPLTNSRFLKVEQVGSYSVSVAPMAKDLVRFDPRVFQINPNVLELIKKQYNTGFGFLICQLGESKAYHPFGYIHKTISPQITRVPTLHYHVPIHGTDTSSDMADDWDHTIYMTSQCPMESKINLGMVNINGKSTSLSDDFTDRNCSIPRDCASDFASFFKKWVPTYPQLSNVPFCKIAEIKVNGSAENGDIFMSSTNDRVIINCDICEKEDISDPAYHCSTCANVDFCNECILKKKHLHTKVSGHSSDHPLVLWNRST
jgi:hypothetical protein